MTNPSTASLPNSRLERHPDSDEFTKTMSDLLNANPTVHTVASRTRQASTSSNSDDECDPIDTQEIYDLLANINDPEHPLTLAQLAVINLDDISIHSSSHGIDTVRVDLTPTIPHCSMATLIGLCVRVRLNRSLPPRYRVDVRVKEGTHQSETAVNRQLADKERVAAACENDQLMGVLGGMMESCVDKA